LKPFEVCKPREPRFGDTALGSVKAVDCVLTLIELGADLEALLAANDIGRRSQADSAQQIELSRGAPAASASM